MFRPELESELQAGSGPSPHYRFHPRVWSHPGVVVDLGCLGWDWSSCFFGKKLVIGADPLEIKEPAGVKLFRGFVGPWRGSVLFGVPKDNDVPAVSGLSCGTTERPMTTLDDLLRRFGATDISLLKMNIEQMEYDLLIHWTKPLADQLVVSFHSTDFSGPETTPAATKAILEVLDQWYDHCVSFAPWGWRVFLRR